MQIFFYPPSLADAAFAAEGIALHGSLAQSQGPRTAADWFLLQGMPINNAPILLQLLQLLLLLLTGLLIASYGKFMYSVLWSWALCCWKCSMFIVWHLFIVGGLIYESPSFPSVSFFFKSCCTNTLCFLRILMWVTLPPFFYFKFTTHL